MCISSPRPVLNRLILSETQKEHQKSAMINSRLTPSKVFLMIRPPKTPPGLWTSISSSTIATRNQEIKSSMRRSSDRSLHRFKSCRFEKWTICQTSPRPHSTLTDVLSPVDDASQSGRRLQATPFLSWSPAWRFRVAKVTSLISVCAPLTSQWRSLESIWTLRCCVVWLAALPMASLFKLKDD